MLFQAACPQQPLCVATHFLAAADALSTAHTPCCLAAIVPASRAPAQDAFGAGRPEKAARGEEGTGKVKGGHRERYKGQSVGSLENKFLMMDEDGGGMAVKSGAAAAGCPEEAARGEEGGGRGELSVRPTHSYILTLTTVSPHRNNPSPRWPRAPDPACGFGTCPPPLPPHPTLHTIGYVLRPFSHNLYTSVIPHLLAMCFRVCVRRSSRPSTSCMYGRRTSRTSRHSCSGKSKPVLQLFSSTVRSTVHSC